MSKQLTTKQEKAFIKYVECGDKLEAYRYAYNTKKMKPETINRKANELLNNDKITERMKELQLKQRREIEEKKRKKARAKAFIDRKERSDLTKLVEEDSRLTPEDPYLWRATLFEATGTTDYKLGETLINQAMFAKFRWHADLIVAKNEVLAAMHEIRPQDIMEGMLGAQMVGVHNLAMECMKRVVIDDQHPEAIYRYAKLANQFSRTFTAQLDALNKHRGKGQQKVTVEHVHVNEGGQAVVGNINQGVGQNEKK